MNLTGEEGAVESHVSMKKKENMPPLNVHHLHLCHCSHTKHCIDELQNCGEEQSERMLQALSLSKYSFCIIIARSWLAISRQVNLGVYFHVSLHACGAQLGLGLQYVGLGFILTSGFALSAVLDPGCGSLFCDIHTYTHTYAKGKR